jgi:excisionase family DNA binding protein
MRRRMTTDHISSPWLELSEAADYLGVHYTTLRRWADAGQAPCIRTPGGRRRFSRAELSAFLAGMRSGQPAHPGLALLGGRLTHATYATEPWYTRLDESQRAAMRVEGQGLMAVLMQYAARANGGEVFLDEGRRVASRYGIACQRAGLSLGETVTTFIHVRRGIMDSVYQAGALAGAPDPDTWRLYDRMNTFLDNMLLAMLESFDSARTFLATEDTEGAERGRGHLAPTPSALSESSVARTESTPRGPSV